MRCRNCHTVMMDTDPICLSCHATAASATAAPPGLTGGTPNGLLLLLPMFGGALGGLLYAGLAPSGASAGGQAVGGASLWRTIKRILGSLLILGGGLFLVGAFVQFHLTSNVAQRDAKAASATELRTRAFVEKPPAWVSYTFEESKPIDEIVVRHRTRHGGVVQAHCMLVRVQNRWLVATVAPGFEGNKLVGQILPLDSPISQPLIARVRNGQSDPKTILPYEFFAVEGCASDQQFRYTFAGSLGAIGLAALLLGVFLLLAGRRAA